MREKELTMKFNKQDVGVFIEGATVYSPTEQAFQVIYFAINQGFNIDRQAVWEAEQLYKTDDWKPQDYEDNDFLLEDSLEYLNTHCTDEGVVFTFVDTDFVLLDSGYDKVVE